jgi:hypothetical protein
MRIDKYRELYPEGRNVSDNDLSRRIYTEMGQPRKELPNPWVTMAWWAAFAVGVPLVVLAVGSALVWALAGFAAPRWRPDAYAKDRALSCEQRHVYMSWVGRGRDTKAHNNHLKNQGRKQAE